MSEIMFPRGFLSGDPAGSEPYVHNTWCTGLIFGRGNSVFKRPCLFHRAASAAIYVLWPCCYFFTPLQFAPKSPFGPERAGTTTHLYCHFCETRAPTPRSAPSHRLETKRRKKICEGPLPSEQPVQPGITYADSQVSRPRKVDGASTAELRLPL